MTTLLVIGFLLTFTVGCAVGAAAGVLVTARNAHRIVARLDAKARLAFARKVNAVTR